MKSYVKKFESFHSDNDTIVQFIEEANNDIEVISYEITNLGEAFMNDIYTTNIFIDSINIENYINDFETIKDTLRNTINNAQALTEQSYHKELVDIITSAKNHIKIVEECINKLKSLDPILKQAYDILNNFKR